jgi:hypothetical protein
MVATRGEVLVKDGPLKNFSSSSAFVISAAVVCVVLDGGGEESVDEGSLAETRLASNLESCEYF